MLIALIIVAVTLTVFSELDNRYLKRELQSKDDEIASLEDQLDILNKKHPNCEECHGEGLTIVGHEVTEFGVIWKQDGTDCKVCKGKGTLQTK